MLFNEHFDNTYHFDGDTLHTFHRNSADNSLIHHTFTPEQIQQHISTTGEHPLNTLARQYGLMQGTLFSPYAGSGRKEDPDTSPEERRSMIQQAFRLTDHEEYKRNMSLFLRESVSEKAIPRDINTLTNTIYESGLPNALIKNVDNPMVVSNKEPKKLGGFVQKRSNVLGAAIYTYKKPLPTIQVPSFERGEAMVNPNFGKHIINAVIKGQQRNGRWNAVEETQKTGTATIRGPVTTDLNKFPEFQTVHISDVGHLFPGSGKETEEYSVQTFDIQTHRNNSFWGNGYTKFHMRFLKKPSENEEMRTIVDPNAKNTGERLIYEPTVTHETGHLLDKNITDPWHPSGKDPIKEGLADGIADRFSRYSGKWEDQLHPSPERAEEISSTGYGLGSWGTKLHKAVYAASRIHASLGDHNYATFPQGKDFGKSIIDDTPNRDPQKDYQTAFLGHLYTHHSHVRQILGHLGLDDIGKKASEYYRTTVTDAGRSHPQDDEGEWPTLF